jgi:hypothetical protein
MSPSPDTPHHLESAGLVGDGHGATPPGQNTLRERLRSEFIEMPGMRLTVGQVQRLCGVERLICTAVLDALVDENFLRRHADGTYARASNNAPAAA